jgi:tetratricopeptide (TPR) repeat protein
LGPSFSSDLDSGAIRALTAFTNEDALEDTDFQALEKNPLEGAATLVLVGSGFAVSDVFTGPEYVGRNELILSCALVTIPPKNALSILHVPSPGSFQTCLNSSKPGHVVNMSEKLVQKVTQLFAQQDFDTAISFLNDAAKAAPVTAQLLLVQAYSLKGDTDLALSTMTHLCSLYPDDLLFQLELASVYWDCGDYKEGLACVDAILEAHHDIPLAHYKKASFCYDLMQYKTAYLHIQDAIAQIPHVGKYISLKAQIESKLGQHADAIESFKLAFSLDEDEPQYMLMFAQCFKYIGDYKEYQFLMSELLKVFPGYMDAIHDAFMFQYALGKFNFCESLAQRAISIHPENAKGYFLLSTAYSAQDKYDEALRAIDTALSNDPENPFYMSQKASLLHQSGQTPDALTELKSSLSGDSPTPFGLVVWASILHDLGQYQKAIHVYKSALKHMPDSQDIMTAIGTSYRLLGNPEKGLEWHRKALQQGSKRAHILVQEGLCLQDLSQTTAAKACFSSALEMKPGLEMAEKALLELGT